MLSFNEVTKRYNYQTIFENFSVNFGAGEKWAIIGQNGSGKSTLLKIVANLEPIDHGSLEWGEQSSMERQSMLRLCAPYTQPLMDMSTHENLEFAAKFGGFRGGLNANDIFQMLPEDKRSEDKPIKLLSSGMLQRVKLLLAMMTKVPVVLLDEPLSNLDEQGAEWYHHLVAEYLQDTLMLVGSNDAKEYSFCTHYIKMGEVPLQHGSIQDLS